MSEVAYFDVRCRTKKN